MAMKTKQNALTEVEVNQLVAARIQRGELVEGVPYKAGDWVALLDGRVVFAAVDLGHVLRELQTIAENPDRGMIVKAWPPPREVVRGPRVVERT